MSSKERRVVHDIGVKRKQLIKRDDYMKCLCKDCNARVVGCHSYCEAYKDFQKYNDEVKEARKKRQQLDSFYYDEMKNLHGRYKHKK